MPSSPGVYLFINNEDKIIYVGKAKSLKNRVSSYFRNKNNLLPKTALMVSQIKKIKIIIVSSEIESLLLEANLIKKYKPKYNVKMLNSKAYPLIRITVKETVPSITTTHNNSDNNSLYFGPFPDSSAIKLVLRHIRKIFPFQSILNHSKNICLYNHIGLCPCVNANPTPINIKNYKKNIKRIIEFLNGKSKKIIKDLEREREKNSKNEKFEDALIIQKQINAINKITKPITSPFEYELNPNLIYEKRDLEIKELMKILEKNDVTVNYLHRIECFDNSNILGTNPTSSMVVLTDGEIDKNQYRKFKIKSVRGANDFASMQEVIGRRFNHKEWSFPDLLVVDGGKGQVSATKEVLDNLKIKIPLIGLAKREEIIVKSDLTEIKIPHDNLGLLLLIKIRNEAHRFAITFHKKLRNKNTF